MRIQPKKQIGFVHTKIFALRFIGIITVLAGLFLLAGLSTQVKGDHQITVPAVAIVSGPGGALGNVSGYGWSSTVGWIKFRDHADLVEEPASPIAKPNTHASWDMEEEFFWDAAAGVNKQFLFLTDGRYFYKYDNDNPSSPVLVASFDYGPGADVREFAVRKFGGVPDDVRAFVALKGEDAVSVLDINNAAGIAEVTRTTDPVQLRFKGVEQVIPGGSFMYLPLGDTETGFTVVSTDESSVTIENTVTTPVGVVTGQVAGCYLFLAGYQYFSVRDICANSVNPPEVGSLSNSSLDYTYGMGVNNNYAFITMYKKDRICAIDFGDIDGDIHGTPQLLACHEDSTELAAAGGIQVKDGFLYVTPVPWVVSTPQEYVTVVDFGNFDEISVVDQITFSPLAQGMSKPLLSNDSFGIYAASETDMHVLTIPYRYTASVRKTDGGALGSKGRFSGYAWSPAIGWVSFNGGLGETGVSPDGDPTGKLDLTPGGIACGGSQYDVCGWGRALYACYHNLWDGAECTGPGAGDKAGGWDGWIKMRGDGGGVLHTKDQDVSTAAAASFLGENADDWSGFSVSGVGDVNGDTLDDFLIGAPLNDEGSASAGKTYLILGKLGGWAMDTNFSTAAAASFKGENADDWSGGSVSGVGDVNGDTFDDFLIGAPRNDEGGASAGKTYLILGRGDWSAVGNADVQTAAAASFKGENADDWSGASVSGAGDVDGDGLDDFIIGAFDDAGVGPGKTYLILGRADWSAVGNVGLGTSVAVASFLGEAGGDYLGRSVSGAGNVNNDPYDDFLIGAPGNDDAAGMAGKTYLILGRGDWSAFVNAGVQTAAAASFLGEDSIDSSGASVSSAGDVDNDGFDDFLIGAYFDEEGTGVSGTGQTYLILGRATADWAPDVSLGTSVAVASFLGEAGGDWSGRSVSGVGDVNGDTFDDFLIDAYRNSEINARAGQTYLILGKSGGWARNIDLSTGADASFLGESADDFSGGSVSGVGDVNGDTFDDFLIGAYGNDEGGAGGQTYLFLPEDFRYGVSWDPPTKELSGWAWGDEVVGWVSFNCLNQGSCGVSDYQVKVYIPISPPNSPPVAAISCSESPCETWLQQGTLDPILTLTNNSSDPDGDIDFVSSEWTAISPLPATLWGSCVGKCDHTVQVHPPDSYTVELEVQDTEGHADTAIIGVVIKQDTEADFKCSFDDITYVDCSTINVPAGVILYFRDTSTPSGIGSFITACDWTFQDGDPPSSSGCSPNPSTKFQSTGPKTVTLEVQDDAGRSDTIIKTINTTLPFPGWIEISPF